jgi:predicted nuclease of predicted toxin-antitoxin system
MKLLFDQNLSRRLVARLADICPNAGHVALLGLDRASDEAVWEHARTNGYVIVTKDADFNDRIVLRGFPPKVVWLRIGNCTTSQAEAAIRKHQQDIDAFLADSTVGILTVY